MSNEDEDLDGSFLEFLERLGPQCKTIKDLVKSEVEAHLGQMQQTGGTKSANYLEAQNEMLLRELLSMKGLKPSTQNNLSDGNIESSGIKSERPPQQDHPGPIIPKKKVTFFK